MGKGTFQERITKAMAPGEVVAICRRDSSDPDGSFGIKLLSITEFGQLEVETSIGAKVATPGNLVKAIEHVSEKLHAGVDMVKGAQVKPPEPQKTSN